MATTLKAPAIKEKFKLLGVLPQGSTPQELTAMNVADAALWGPIIKEANIKVECKWRSSLSRRTVAHRR